MRGDPKLIGRVNEFSVLFFDLAEQVMQFSSVFLLY